MSSVLHYFDELGARIEARFRAVNYLEDSLIEIAASELARTPAHEYIRDPLDLLVHVAQGHVLPAQFSQDLAFGQPPVTVFSAARFVIDVYFWFEGTTSIHEHSFCGAFQVLAGSSLHSIRRFRCEQVVNGHFLLGVVETNCCEVLKTGDIRHILAGDAFAHSLFHLDHPSVTVVVRTRTNPRSGVQYNYAPPYVAYDQFHHPHTRVLQHASLTALANTSPARHSQAFQEAAAQITLDELYFLLLHEALRDINLPVARNPRIRAAVTLAEARYGAVMHKIADSVGQAQMRRSVNLGRKASTDPEERFVVAAMLNAHSREQVIDFIRSRFPTQDPVVTFLGIFEKLAKRVGDGEDNALGLELSEDAMQIVRLMAAGVAREDVPRKLIELGHTEEQVLRQEESVFAFYDLLRDTTPVGVLAR